MGLELVDKIHNLIGVNIRVPTGYLGNYKFSKHFFFTNIKKFSGMIKNLLKIMK